MHKNYGIYVHPMESLALLLPQILNSQTKIGTERDAEKEWGERKNTRKKEEEDKQKKEDSAQKDYYPLSPIYNPNYKEDALSLIDLQILTPETENEKKQEEEEKALYMSQVMKKPPSPSWQFSASSRTSPRTEDEQMTKDQGQARRGQASRQRQNRNTWRHREKTQMKIQTKIGELEQYVCYV